MGKIEDLYYKRVELIQQILEPIKPEYKHFVYSQILSSEIKELEEIIESSVFYKKGEKNV